jgi:hypothetical protein
MAKGYVTIRNEDGTQWLEILGRSSGKLFWSWGFSKSRAKTISRNDFDLLKHRQAESVKANGYLGMYKLEFHEVK